MVVAGLTGGIASGKSTVAGFLENGGALIIDADQIARQVVQKGEPAWHAIVAQFGKQVLGPDGQLAREVLGDLIFNDPELKERLNRIVHPRVHQQIMERIRALARQQPGAVVVLDVPLLFEANMDRALDAVIVVYLPRALQLERLMTRNRLRRKDALARIRSQMSLEEKRVRATWVIDNSGSLAETRRQAVQVLAHLMSRAAGHQKD